MNKKPLHTILNYKQQFIIDIAKNAIVYNELDESLWHVLVDAVSTDTLELLSKLKISEQSGTIKDYLGNTPPSGYIRCNGQTIGNASSGATNRANEDTRYVFYQIWNTYPNNRFPVNPEGRGISAQADFDANKTITTPNVTGITVASGQVAIKIIKL
jgi:hypothetical protein